MMTQDQTAFFFEKAKMLSQLKFYCRDGADGIKLAGHFTKEWQNSRMFRHFVNASELFIDGDVAPTNVWAYFRLAQESLCMYNTWKGQTKGMLRVDFNDTRRTMPERERELLMFRLWWAVKRGFPNGESYHPYTQSQGFRVTGRRSEDGGFVTLTIANPLFSVEIVGDADCSDALAFRAALMQKLDHVSSETESAIARLDSIKDL